jgi:hypothetical protein
LEAAGNNALFQDNDSVGSNYYDTSTDNLKISDTQLLDFGPDRDCAIILNGLLIDTVAIMIAAACKTPKCRMNAEKLID